MKKILFVIFLISSFGISAQEKKEEPAFGIKFSGFVKSDIFYDSRQTINIREGHFLLYPDNISYDANKKDINAVPGFNMLSIQSRLKGTITGPDAFGAKTSGVIEADFFGNENASFSDVNGFRLRHAYVKLNWKNTELLAGQYWHPMFIAESFPDVLSFNTGAPFQPFSRNPQLRFSYKVSILKIIATALTQRDFTGIGPEYTLKSGLYEVSSVASSKYLRNSAIPDLDLQVQITPKSSDNIFGFGVDYKTIVPELFTVNNARTKKFASSETLSSISGIAFAKIKLKPVTIKLEGVYAQNAYDMVMIGGYAVKQVNDTATGAKEFTNLNTASAWLDVNTNGSKIQFGLFAGFTKNMGSNDSINSGSFYARGANIDYVYRISPRVVFVSGKLNVGFESEFTQAMYGIANSNNKGKAEKGQVAVKNLRANLSFIYKF